MCWFKWMNVLGKVLSRITSPERSVATEVAKWTKSRFQKRENFSSRYWQNKNQDLGSLKLCINISPAWEMLRKSQNDFFRQWPCNVLENKNVEMCRLDTCTPTFATIGKKAVI